VKTIISKIVIIAAILVITTQRGFAATYDWVGTTATAGVYDWNNKLNWQVAGVAAVTIPGAADIVRIGVLPFTFNPTVTDAETCASIIFGTYDNFTLTVNGTLTVSGNITQNNDPNFYQYTVLAGTGTITCGSITVGDNTAPSASTGIVTNISSQVSLLKVNGNITLNAVGNSAGNGIAYPYFSLDANQLTLTGQIVTATSSNPLYGGVGDPNFPGYGLFQADTQPATTTLELQNINPVLTPIPSGFTIDFTNNGGAANGSGIVGHGTVIYDAASGTQTVYATGTTGIGINNYNYANLNFAGASSKTVTGGSFTVGGTWTTAGTGAVNLNTNNPTITVFGQIVNSTNITQGSGSITVSGALQNTSGTITLGSGTLAVGGALQLNGGAINGGSGAITVTGAFQNTAGTYTCGSGSLTLNGNYTNSSVFTAGAGTVFFSGAAQTLTDNSASGTTFKNVTFNGSGTATMSAGTGNFAVSSTGVLTVTSPANLVAGTATVPYLTLKSDATGSATVAALSGTSTITGFVNVQRYITGGSATYRGYRLLSSSVNIATVGSNPVFNFDYIHSSILLTGAAGGGFDKTGNPSLYMYRENQAFSNVAFTLGNFSEVTAINNSPSYNIYTDGIATNYNPLAGNGFLVFFRGDRTTNLANKYKPGTVAESVTLTETGTLNQGSITVHDWYTPASANLGYSITAGNALVRGYNLVGNPYASSINWDLLNSLSASSGIYGTNVGSTIYVFDPVSRNYGAYVAGTGGVGTHNTTNILPSGQGFFVVATSAAAKMIFNESAKVNTQLTGPSLLMGLPKQIVNQQYIHLMLAKDSINTDDAIIHLKGDASTAYTPQTEALYNPGMGSVSISSLTSDKVALAINSQPFPKTWEKIALKVNAIADGSYQIKLKNLVGIPKIYRIWLVDNFTKDSVNFRTVQTYNFSINKKDSTTFGPDRFMLSIGQDAAYAYKLVNFTGERVPAQPTKQVQLNWHTTNEENYTTFTVERSTDNGLTFEVVGGKQGNGSGSYGLVDKAPGSGVNIYRLRQQDINNVISYSPLVTIQYTNQTNNLASSNIHIYPNPAKSVVTLTIAQNAIAKTPDYKIRISNSSGLMVREIQSVQSNWQGNVSDLVTGTYMIQVISTKDNSLVGQTKFVKL